MAAVAAASEPNDAVDVVVAVENRPICRHCRLCRRCRGWCLAILAAISAMANGHFVPKLPQDKPLRQGE